MQSESKKLDIERESMNAESLSGRWLCFAVIIFLLILGVSMSSFTPLMQVLGSDRSISLPISMLVLILIIVSVFMIPSLVVTVLYAVIKERYRTWEPSSADTQSLVKMRREVKEIVDEDKVVSLDEYWEVGIAILTLAVVSLSLLYSGIQYVSGWTQVIITITFWVSYKVAKAKHSIDLRLLTIGAVVQFIVIILTLIGMSFAIDLIIENWIFLGAPRELGYSFPGWGWMLIFWDVLLAMTLILSLSKTIGVRFGHFCWKHLISVQDQSEKKQLEFSATYQLNNAMPSYLFYGVIWFLTFLIPLTIEEGLSNSAIDIIVATLIMIISVVIGWILKIRYANWKLIGKQFGIVGKIFIVSGNIAISLASLILGLMLVIFTMFYTTFLAFSYGLVGVTGLVNGLLGGSLLIIVQTESFVNLGGTKSK